MFYIMQLNWICKIKCLSCVTHVQSSSIPADRSFIWGVNYRFDLFHLLPSMMRSKSLMTRFGSSPAFALLSSVWLLSEIDVFGRQETLICIIPPVPLPTSLAWSLGVLLGWLWEACCFNTAQDHLYGSKPPLDEGFAFIVHVVFLMGAIKIHQEILNKSVSVKLDVQLRTRTKITPRNSLYIFLSYTAFFLIILGPHDFVDNHLMKIL